MNQSLSIGWLKIGLRTQICSQCHPIPAAADPSQLLDPHSCEAGCALFVQLPRLARLLERNRADLPAGYEEFVQKLLVDSTGEASGHFLEYTNEALVILERILELVHEPEPAVRKGDPAPVEVTTHTAKSHVSAAFSPPRPGTPSADPL